MRPSYRRRWSENGLISSYPMADVMYFANNTILESVKVYAKSGTGPPGNSLIYIRNVESSPYAPILPNLAVATTNAENAILVATDYSENYEYELILSPSLYVPAGDRRALCDFSEYTKVRYFRSQGWTPTGEGFPISNEESNVTTGGIPQNGTWSMNPYYKACFQAFGTIATIPVVYTGQASYITHKIATLNGVLVYDHSEACNCGFQWGETDSYGYTTSANSKVTGESFSSDLSRLSDSKTYHFRAFASCSSTGMVYGADKIFTTSSPPPISPPGDNTIVAPKVSLEAIRNIEITYGGRFYISKSGNAVYESRYHRNV